MAEDRRKTATGGPWRSGHRVGPGTFLRRDTLVSTTPSLWGVSFPSPSQDSTSSPSLRLYMHISYIITTHTHNTHHAYLYKSTRAGTIRLAGVNSFKHSEPCWKHSLIIFFPLWNRGSSISGAHARGARCMCTCVCAHTRETEYFPCAPRCIAASVRRRPLSPHRRPKSSSLLAWFFRLPCCQAQQL